MIWIILGIVIGLITAWIFASDAYGPIEAVFVFVFVGGAAVLLASIVTISIGSIIGVFLPQEPIFEKRYELVALQDSTSVNGHFFLGTGSVDEVMKYYFYRKEGSGFRSDSADANNAVIFEDSPSTPYADFYMPAFKHKVSGWIAIPWKDRPTEFHVPSGSILQNYTLDLKK